MIWHVHDRTGAALAIREHGFEIFAEPVQHRIDNRVIHGGERPVHRAVLDLRE